MLKAGFISLGCPKNLVDTECMLGIIQKNGIEIINEPEQADLLIINTCGFLESAIEESVDTILQFAEYKKTGKCRALLVTGCSAQRFPEQLLTEIPEIDGLIGTASCHRIMEAIEAVLNGRKVAFLDDFSCGAVIADTIDARLLTTPSYRAYVKIAEGCNNRCSYCVIPYLRGPYRSRPLEAIITEVELLAQKGVREIILVAQDTTQYGYDLYKTLMLPTLLQKLAQIKGIIWIRLMYCYADSLTDELIEVMATEPKICKYIDLPLQHAHDEILKKMCRRDTLSSITNLLNKIRSRIDNVTIRTTFIVGFPGETDEHFQTLKNFLIEQRFDRVGIFSYSQEEGTIAGAMENQITDDIKEDRYHELMSLQAKISEEINIDMENKIIDILIEGYSDDQPNVAFGRSYRDAPEIDGTVYVEMNTPVDCGTFVQGKIVQGYTYDLYCEQIPTTK